MNAIIPPIELLLVCMARMAVDGRKQTRLRRRRRRRLGGGHESETESEWFIEKAVGPSMSIVVTNTVKQLQVNVRLTGTTSVQTKRYCVHQKPCVEK